MIITMSNPPIIATPPIFGTREYAHTREILKEHRTLNISMMNILSNIIFINWLDITTAHSMF